ncbi:hypothetical protein JQM84_04055 [Parabacteroides distasonis]|nr:hypothetical protein [Parabacteroides distasonis]
MKRVFLVFAVLLMGATAVAQTTETKEDLKGEVSVPLSSMRLANDLIRYGYAQQSALPLIQALEIMAETPTQTLRGEKENTQEASKDGTLSYDYNKIVADAKEFADGNEHLLALISSIEEEKAGSSRGAVNGPTKHVDVVNGDTADNYQISFVANYLAEILVSGDGDTDLDLYVYDSNGNLIAKDDDYMDDCYVSWIPAWTGRFKVRIVNRGPISNRYVLLTN